MVHALDEMAAKQRSVTPAMPEPCAEMILHSSNVSMGILPNDTVILSFTLPFGLRISVPFSSEEWEQVRGNSSRVRVATAMPTSIKKPR